MKRELCRAGTPRGTAVLLGGLLLAGCVNPAVAVGAAQPRRVGIECEQFQFPGGWTIVEAEKDDPGCLSADAGADFPAATAVKIPRAGAYTLWVRTLDFPTNRPGTRTFAVAIGGVTNSTPFGQTGQAGWNWERGDTFTLASGPVLLTLHDQPNGHYGRADALLLCDDPAFVPHGNFRAMKLAPVKPIVLKARAKGAVVPISPVVAVDPSAVLARLENENVRVGFVAAQRAGKPSACPVLEVKGPSGWIAAQLDPSAESYQVLAAQPTTQIKTRGYHPGFHPKWSKPYLQAVTVTLNGLQVATCTQSSQAIWHAGQGHEGIVRAVRQAGPQRLELDFYPTAAGTLRAVWELLPGAKTIRIEMTFTPAAAGQYSLGYFLFNRKPLAEVQELLLPMLVQRKRFPTTDYTLLQALCPTPVSLMQTAVKGGSLTWGVAADPTEIPYEFPVPVKSRFGLHIRNPQGQVQPSIYGPIIGLPGAQAQAGQPVKFALRVLVEPGDWYAAYRTSADEIFGWRDYRVNGRVSLTQAALNMIDLYLDDAYGGWWERAKAPYQIESKNGSTQSSPLTAVSLYRLTGNAELYQRRTLPTLEFTLSRSGPHFSPIPSDTGGYPPGSMKGPVDIYGTTTYGGLWEIMNRRTPAFREIALPETGVRRTTTQQGFKTHNQLFDEWLGRYLFTGEKSALDHAIREADAYIKGGISTPPSDDLGVWQFFLTAYTPAWEGLLRLYEVTQEKRFLDAAVAGARLVMTGMWTQPTPREDDITIHPGGFCHGDLVERGAHFHKGAENFRLGWPRKPNDTPEHKAPGWLVSNVGLGFEQPCTYMTKDNGGRMIFQQPWAAAFLRLARYTGDPQFETYARNAVVGRWGNYPGYYITTFTDLMQNPRYPYDGPDMGLVYYHHILVHLSWTLDYLVSEAALRSHGAIAFPALRQFGYAFFDNLVYGHAPGEILGARDVWLWLRKDLVSLDNPQINYLTAHSGDKFFVILMNETRQPEPVTITFQPANIAKDAGVFHKARVLTDKGGELALTQNAAQVVVAPRGLTVVQVDGLAITVPAHRRHPEPKPSQEPGAVTMPSGDNTEVRAAAIQIEPGPWQAFVWSTADAGALKEITLTWTAGEKSGVLKDTDYPYEFSVPVPTGQTAFRFTTMGIKADNTPFSTPEKTIGVSE